MMNDEKKSDSAILAMNPANNGPKGPAEPGERRAGAKGNPAAQSMGRAQKRLTMSQAGNDGSNCPPTSQWMSHLLERRPNNVASVALANKNARTMWALLAHDRHYERNYRCQPA